MSQTDQKKAYAYALATVACWSTVASAFKLSLRYLDPIQLLFYAALASALVLVLALAASGGFPALRAAPRREKGRALALGLLNPFLYYLILFAAYDRLPAQEAQPLNYTWAVTLSLLAVPLLGQRLAAFDLAGILVSYLGVVLIATHGDPAALRFESPSGVALALASTVVWALYWIYSAKGRLDPVAGLLLNFLSGAAATGLVLIFWSSPGVDDWRGLAGAAYVGVFEMGLTFVLWLKALKLSTSSAKVANLIFLSPFLSLLLIHFLVGEDIAGSTLAGLAFILGGNALRLAGSRKSTKPKPEAAPAAPESPETLTPENKS